MDLFKVLTRSTNIQKSSLASKEKLSSHVPSAGLAHVDQNGISDPDRVVGHGILSGRGVKRKRQEISEGNNNPVVVEQDEGLVKTATINKREILNGGQEHVQVENSKKREEPRTPLNEEECRRILKQHKLKITVLQGPNQFDIEGGVVHGRSERIGKKNTHTQFAPQPLASFKHLRGKYGVSKRLLENLSDQGYREPTEVQIGSLPLLLGLSGDVGLAAGKSGKNRKRLKPHVDLLTIAPTGSGKTLCFMIHLINGLLENRQALKDEDQGSHIEHKVQSLVIAPTHELVDQIVNEGKKLAQGTGIKVAGFRKGMNLQAPRTRKGDKVSGYDEDVTQDQEDGQEARASGATVKADILVTTPLALLNAIASPSSMADALSEIRFLVLDEADVLLDPLFRDQTLRLWDSCTHKSLQTSLWSATVGSSIESLAQSFILDRRKNLGLAPENHHLLRLVVGLKDTAIPNIQHRLVYAASEQGKLLALRQLLHPAASTHEVPLQPPFLIFTQTIPRAVALHSELVYDIPLEAGGSSRIAVLHSDLSETARSNIMASFRKGEIWILITTDLLSRGVDFRGMNGVVNYDIPNTSTSYVHRVGRTGRQGREGGVAVTLYTKDDIPYMKNIANVIAASERANGKSIGVPNEAKSTQKWLLDALPNVSKKTKQILKRQGVQSRRTDADDDGRAIRKARISTKSGHDRRLENRRKGAIVGSRKRESHVTRDSSKDVISEDEEWGGFGD